MRAPWLGLGGQHLAPHRAPAPQLQLRLSLVFPTGKHSEVLPALSVTRGGFGHCPKGFGFLHSLQPSPAIRRCIAPRAWRVAQSWCRRLVLQHNSGVLCNLLTSVCVCGC